SATAPALEAPLADHVVIVTGASAGLGAQLAAAVVGAGGHAVLAARRRERLDALAQRLGRATAVQCDVGVEADRYRLVERALDHHGRLDGLVNAAGVSRPGPASRESLKTFREQLELNLVAPFALAQLAAARMREQEGGGRSIVNVASVMGLRSLGQLPEAGYVASKAGLLGLTRELASQWGRHGIRVNAIAPGFFPSEMTEGLIDARGGAPDWLVGNTPLARVGRGGELDAAAVFLLSAGSAFMTGQTVVVDGGLSTRS
ncbi:MAG TPA: SDR family oxidoreductase, partial [Conexibacter sp.]